VGSRGIAMETFTEAWVEERLEGLLVVIVGNRFVMGRDQDFKNSKRL
jgi:hypothetical protein